MVVNTIATGYSDIGELFDRMRHLENMIQDYISKKPEIANKYNTEVLVGPSKYVLTFILIKE